MDFLPGAQIIKASGGEFNSVFLKKVLGLFIGIGVISVTKFGHIPIFYAWAESWCS